MQLVEVNDATTRKEFLQVPKVLYKNDKVWVCMPDPEIESVFNSGTNPFFQHGEAVRWLLKDDEGRLTGRVAAFINKNKAFTYQQPTGGMGFFECIDDQAAANILFDACRNWLEERGMQAMDGPVNFGENDNYWGLLVEGFIHPGIGMNYNFPYYQQLFENYGFKFYFEQVTNHLDLTVPFPERFWKIAEWVMRKPGLRFEHFNLKEADRYIQELKTIYDDAWQFHESFTPIEPAFLKASLAKAKVFLEEKFIWFVYVDDQPAAFFICFPDINQIFKKLQGRLDWWGKLKFYYYLKTHTITRARVTIMGAAPRYQKMGLESAIFWHMSQVMKTKPWYTELELSWVGDFNPKMRSLHEAVGGTFGKRHITYRKVFIDSSEEQRSYTIPMDTRDRILKNSE
ncbi:MAG: GNAT family N-acetyltransferase [Bacteroidetes bacterium]|nr:GNAT family N-acetyltransferase [Bacteroidota bacterium]